MANFVVKSTVKSYVRKLTAPIENMTMFQNLITYIITNNPWDFVDSVSNGTTIDGCLKGTERYTGKVVYERECSGKKRLVRSASLPIFRQGSTLM